MGNQITEPNPKFDVQQINIFDELECWVNEEDYVLGKPCDEVQSLFS